MNTLRTRLNGSSAPLSPRTVTAKPWTGTLTNAELIAAGFEDAPDQWALIKGLLRLKGLPEEYLADGTPFRCDTVDDGLVLQFGGTPIPTTKH